MPSAFPSGSLALIAFDGRRREAGRPQGLPGGVARILRRQALFVEQGIPVAGELLQQRQ